MGPTPKKFVGLVSDTSNLYSFQIFDNAKDVFDDPLWNYESVLHCTVKT